MQECVRSLFNHSRMQQVDEKPYTDLQEALVAEGELLRHWR